MPLVGGSYGPARRARNAVPAQEAQDLRHREGDADHEDNHYQLALVEKEKRAEAEEADDHRHRRYRRSRRSSRDCRGHKSGDYDGAPECGSRKKCDSETRCPERLHQIGGERGDEPTSPYARILHVFHYSLPRNALSGHPGFLYATSIYNATPALAGVNRPGCVVLAIQKQHEALLRVTLRHEQLCKYRLRAS